MRFIFSILLLGVCLVIVATDDADGPEYETYMEIDMILSVGLDLPSWKRVKILEDIGASKYLQANEKGYEVKWKRFRDVDLTKIEVIPEDNKDTTGCWVATADSTHYYFRKNGSLEYTVHKS